MRAGTGASAWGCSGTYVLLHLGKRRHEGVDGLGRHDIATRACEQGGQRSGNETTSPMQRLKSSMPCTGSPRTQVQLRNGLLRQVFELVDVVVDKADQHALGNDIDDVTS